MGRREEEASRGVLRVVDEEGDEALGVNEGPGVERIDMAAQERKAWRHVELVLASMSGREAGGFHGEVVVYSVNSSDVGRIFGWVGRVLWRPTSTLNL